MNQPTNCICCNVENCVYNENCNCTAKNVQVGPQFCSCTARCSDETICATFKPRT